MAITFVGSASSIADGGSETWNGTANTPISIPLPAGLANNDYFVVIASYRTNNTTHRIRIAEPGGQNWHAGNFLVSGGLLTKMVAGCIYNGTWTATANVVVTDLTSNTVPITIHSLAFRPTDANHRIVPDISTGPRLLSSLPSGAGPTFTYTFNNRPTIDRTPIRANNATWASVQFAEDVTIGWSTSGWTSTIDNHTNLGGSDITGSIRYKIQSATTATGNLTVTTDSDIQRGVAIVGTISEVLATTLEPTGTSSRLFIGPGFGGSGSGPTTGSLFSVLPSDNVAKVEFDDVVPTDNATAAVWVYLNYLPGKDDSRFFVRHRTSANNINAVDFSMMLGLSSGTATPSRLRIRWNNPASATLLCNTTLSTGQWYHLCSTFNRSTGTGIGYVNGTNDGSLATFNTGAWDTANTHKIVIGNNATFDNGTIADIAPWGYISQPVFWGAELSADEVASLSQGLSPLSIRPQDLLFYVPELGRNDIDVDVIGGKTATQTSTIPSRFGPQIKRRTGATYS